MSFTTEWHWRSREPAKSPPDPNYPYGIAIDLSAGHSPACEEVLAYPAPGVGTWLLVCDVCGYSAAVTAAGRADDPTKVLVPCKAKARWLSRHPTTPRA